MLLGMPCVSLPHLAAMQHPMRLPTLLECRVSLPQCSPARMLLDTFSSRLPQHRTRLDAPHHAPGCVMDAPRVEFPVGSVGLQPFGTPGHVDASHVEFPMRLGFLDPAELQDRPEPPPRRLLLVARPQALSGPESPVPDEITRFLPSHRPCIP